MPEMTLEAVGYGAGTKDLQEQPNVLRLMIGTTADSAESDSVWVLETNLDDLAGEAVAFCSTQLLAAGALDVFSTPIQMKKNRPGVLLSVLCRDEDVERLEDIVFRETTTFGVRRYRVLRHKLRRRPHTVETPWGPVEGKLGWRAGGPPKFAPEFESCRRVAEEQGIAFREVYQAALSAFQANEKERSEP
jgi:uncharacterized protein (DUF111 family)